ncbi:MAG: hypothetical protein A3J69_02605 [Candidatus Levybacteria bacterium RIFCSPHIGHO2_02_FULL_42_12]|nr:MAG: hypothetical protein A3J69_02605 [Candidatus Levybacteria bacterium RIFCSPHIGHO2_02_FULL_42_12]OGH43096.1 MAG: hypothetical protein A3B53_03215 [Candidatus Levybacteria bacterium RIFCSPLOWO2_01_FULL_42_15]
MNETVSIIPLGGVGDVTRNMYLYEYGEFVLIVDCGLGFADETMTGVDLLLPDISYLLSSKKKIVGMLLTHGHEDHIGALPFILPQLPSIPIFASPLTAAFANEKLKEFKLNNRVVSVPFDSAEKTLGPFSATFIRVTHSVPDTAHIFLRTPVGNFYHGSDFKFDLTPYDKKPSELQRIVEYAKKGVVCLLSDCLRSEVEGSTPSELSLGESFEKEMQACKGRFIVTTYSSNISRLNQAIKIGERLNRKVCFVGRSLMKAKGVASRIGYMNLARGQEISIDKIRQYKPQEVLLIVAGSQGQQNSALTRIAYGEHSDITLNENDVVVFSADSIPGNEIAINALIDEIARKGTKVIYSGLADSFHVSGHGASNELMLLASLTRPSYFLPIGGTFRQMVAYRGLIEKLGYAKDRVLLVENGQEIQFNRGKALLGKKLPLKTVYVDEITGEEVEHFVVRDRQKLSKDGIAIVMVEISRENGRIVGTPDVVARGIPPSDVQIFRLKLTDALQTVFRERRGDSGWFHAKKRIGEISERLMFSALNREPLILPIVVEV